VRRATDDTTRGTMARQLVDLQDLLTAALLLRGVSLRNLLSKLIGEPIKWFKGHQDKILNFK